MADDYWRRMVSECVEEMMRISEEAERNVYDYVVPALLERNSPQDREQFYVEGSPDSPLFAQGFDWGVLKNLSPQLWERYSADALNLQQRQVQQGAEALDQLRQAQRIEGYDFQHQISPPQVFGLHTGKRTTTASAGLDTALSVPMGRFANG